MHRNTLTLTTDFLQSRGFQAAKEEILQDLTQYYAHKLRGKYLFQIYELIFQIRKANDKQEITFTKEQLILVCLKEGLSQSDGLTNKILAAIIEKLKD